MALHAWGTTRRVSKDDWLEWLRRLSLELLKDSSSPSLRSCWALAQAYNPMARYAASGLPPPRLHMGSCRKRDREKFILISSDGERVVLILSSGGKDKKANGTGS